MDELKICTAYRLDGEEIQTPPTNPEDWERLEPIYQSFPGWKETTRGVTDFEKLPAIAQSYLSEVENLAGAPVHMVSTGPDRSENIIIKHPLS